MDPLDDASRHRADVGPPVSADLGFVLDAAQGQPDELAPERARDRAPERGLPDSGRPDEAEDRPLALLPQLADREVFQDAVLDRLQGVVIVIQDRARLDQIEVVLGRLAPRHAE